MEVFDLQGKASIDISPYVSGIKEATQMNEALIKSLEATSKKVDSLGDTISQTKGSVDKLTEALDKQGKETQDEGEASDEAAEETKKLGNEIKTTGEHSEKATSKIKDLADSLKTGLAVAAKVGAAAVGAAATGVGVLVKQSIGNYSEYEQLAGGIKKIYGDVADDVIKNAEESFAKSATNINEYLSGVTGFSQTLIQSLGRGAQTDIDELKEALDTEYTMTKQTLEDEYDDVKSYWNERIKASKAAKDGQADALQAERDEELKALKRSNEAQLKELKAHNKEVVAEAERANQQTGEITEETYKKAADYADMIMRDIADNASTFGKYTADELTNVYNALSRGSYMTLDNLNLGYKGTKSEMERLIADANDYAESIGEVGGMTVDSFADIVRAIDLIQRKIGISETAAHEAGTTITGSIKGVKDAWTNLTIEMAKGDGDIDHAFEMLGESAAAVFENMLPKVENALGGVGKLIEAAAPKVSAGLKQLLPKVMPDLLKTAGSIVSTVGQALITSLPEFLDVGKDLLKTIAEIDFSGNGMAGNLLDAIIGNVDDYMAYGEQILANIGNAIINADHSKLGETFSKIVTSGLNSITNLLADLDMKKIGENIAEFMKAVDWKAIARSVVDLLGAALGSLGDIAIGFFQNMDGDTFLSSLSLIAAPKLLGSMLTAFKGPSCATEFGSIKQFLSAEIGASGDGAGIAWSSAFMVGLKAFGLGYAIGTYLRDNIVIGDKTLGEWVDYAFDKVGDPTREEREEQTKEDYGMYTTSDGRQGIKYDEESESGLSEAFLNSAARGNVEYENIAERVQAMRGLAGLTDNFYFNPEDKVYQNQNTRAEMEALEKQFIEEIEGPKKTPAQTQAVSYGMPAEILDRLTHNAICNYVTKPTVSWVAENEPEYIIPESKMDKVYSRNGGDVYVEKVEFVINGSFDMGSPEDRRKLAEEMSAELRMLNIAEERAMGGRAW